MQRYHGGGQHWDNRNRHDQGRDRDRDRDRDGDRDRHHNRDRDRNQNHERNRERDQERHRERERQRQLDRERRQREQRERERRQREQRDRERQEALEREEEQAAGNRNRNGNRDRAQGGNQDRDNNRDRRDHRNRDNALRADENRNERVPSPPAVGNDQRQRERDHERRQERGYGHQGRDRVQRNQDRNDEREREGREHHRAPEMHREIVQRQPEDQGDEELPNEENLNYIEVIENIRPNEANNLLEVDLELLDRLPEIKFDEEFKIVQELQNEERNRENSHNAHSDRENTPERDARSRSRTPSPDQRGQNLESPEPAENSNLQPKNDSVNQEKPIESILKETEELESNDIAAKQNEHSETHSPFEKIERDQNSTASPPTSSDISTPENTRVYDAESKTANDGTHADGLQQNSPENELNNSVRNTEVAESNSMITPSSDSIDSFNSSSLPSRQDSTEHKTESPELSDIGETDSKREESTTSPENLTHCPNENNTFKEKEFYDLKESNPEHEDRRDEIRPVDENGVTNKSNVVELSSEKLETKKESLELNEKPSVDLEEKSDVIGPESPSENGKFNVDRDEPLQKPLNEFETDSTPKMEINQLANEIGKIFNVTGNLGGGNELSDKEEIKELNSDSVPFDSKNAEICEKMEKRNKNEVDKTVKPTITEPAGIDIYHSISQTETLAAPQVEESVFQSPITSPLGHLIGNESAETAISSNRSNTSEELSDSKERNPEREKERNNEIYPVDGNGFTNKSNVVEQPLEKLETKKENLELNEKPSVDIEEKSDVTGSECQSKNGKSNNDRDELLQKPCTEFETDSTPKMELHQPANEIGKISNITGNLGDGNKPNDKKEIKELNNDSVPFDCNNAEICEKMEKSNENEVIQTVKPTMTEPAEIDFYNNSISQTETLAAPQVEESVFQSPITSPLGQLIENESAETAMKEASLITTQMNGESTESSQDKVKDEVTVETITTSNGEENSKDAHDKKEEAMNSPEEESEHVTNEIKNTSVKIPNEEDRDRRDIDSDTLKDLVQTCDTNNVEQDGREETLEAFAKPGFETDTKKPLFDKSFKNDLTSKLECDENISEENENLTEHILKPTVTETEMESADATSVNSDRDVKFTSQGEKSIHNSSEDSLSEKLSNETSNETEIETVDVDKNDSIGNQSELHNEQFEKHPTEPLNNDAPASQLLQTAIEEMADNNLTESIDNETKDSNQISDETGNSQKNNQNAIDETKREQTMETSGTHEIEKEMSTCAASKITQDESHHVERGIDNEALEQSPPLKIVTKEFKRPFEKTVNDRTKEKRIKENKRHINLIEKVEEGAEHNPVAPKKSRLETETQKLEKAEVERDHFVPLHTITTSPQQQFVYVEKDVTKIALPASKTSSHITKIFPMFSTTGTHESLNVSFRRDPNALSYRPLGPFAARNISNRERLLMSIPLPPTKQHSEVKLGISRAQNPPTLEDLMALTEDINKRHPNPQTHQN